MTFVDASAIVGILGHEPDRTDLLARLEASCDPITSPIAVFEAVLALTRLFRGTVEELRLDVMAFLASARIRVVAITPAEAELALRAFARFGKGQEHPAQLNMADCFAYAAARHHGAAMLCKGDDFPQTDIQLA